MNPAKAFWKTGRLEDWKTDLLVVLCLSRTYQSVCQSSPGSTPVRPSRESAKTLPSCFPPRATLLSLLSWMSWILQRKPNLLIIREKQIICVISDKPPHNRTFGLDSSPLPSYRFLRLAALVNGLRIVATGAKRREEDVKSISVPCSHAVRRSGVSI